MSREDIKKILGENASEEQITNVLNELHSQTNALNQTIKDLEAKNSKYSDYDSIKSQLDAFNNEKLTEQEKLAKEKEETAKNLKESKIIKNKAQVMTILAGRGIDDEIIDSIISEDENISIAKAQKLVASLDNLISNTKKTTQEELANLNTNPNMTNDDPNKDNIMTFEKFRSMSYAEQTKFAQEHPEEFANL